jgi:hypothetical protein
VAWLAERTQEVDEQERVTKVLEALTEARRTLARTQTYIYIYICRDTHIYIYTYACIKDKTLSCT